MTDQRYIPYKKVLERLQGELQLSLSKTDIDAGQTISDVPKDVGEQVHFDLLADVMFERASYKRELLRKVEAALVRIYNETYGECLRCGESIEEKRLQAMPFASYCLDCQERIESHTFSGPKAA